jgi:hypothetical protein
LVGATSATITSNGPFASTTNTSAVVLPQHSHAYTTTIGNKIGTASVGTKVGSTTADTQITGGSLNGSNHAHYVNSSGDNGADRFVVHQRDSTTWSSPYRLQIPLVASNASSGYGLVVRDPPSADRWTGNATPPDSSGSWAPTVTVTIPKSTLQVSTTIGDISVTTDIGNPTGTTASTGDAGASMSILSKSVRVHWFIRFA